MRIAREITLPSQALIDKVGASTVGALTAEREQRPAEPAGDGNSGARAELQVPVAAELIAFSDQDPLTEVASSWNSAQQRDLEELERENEQLKYEEQERMAHEWFCGPCDAPRLHLEVIPAVRNFMVTTTNDSSDADHDDSRNDTYSPDSSDREEAYWRHQAEIEERQTVSFEEAPGGRRPR